MSKKYLLVILIGLLVVGGLIVVDNFYGVLPFQKTKVVKLGEIFRLKQGQSARIKDTNLTIKYTNFKIHSCPPPDEYIFGECMENKLFEGKINGNKIVNLAGASYGGYILSNRTWIEKDVDEKIFESIVYKDGECEVIKDDNTRDQCNREKTDIFSCEKIKDSAGRFNCTSELLKQSIESGKLDEISLKNICEKNMNNNTWCLSMYNITQARLTKNIAFCEKIIDHREKDNCWEQMAKFYKKGNFCDNIEYIEEKDICYGIIARATGAVIWCDKINNDIRKGFCRDSQAGIEGIKRICESWWEISNDTIGCLDRYYFQVATDVGDSELCNRISDKASPGKDYCIAEISKNGW